MKCTLQIHSRYGREINLTCLHFPLPADAILTANRLAIKTAFGIYPFAFGGPTGYTTISPRAWKSADQHCARLLPKESS
jgi:hypothetical protein